MKLIITAFLAFITLQSALLAQSEFAKEWETKLSVENKWNSYPADLSMVLVGNLQAFSMIDGTNGKTLWTFNAKEKLGVKSVEDWIFHYDKENEPVRVVYTKNKEDVKTILFLNSKTGEINSSMNESALKDKSQNNKRRKKSNIRYADECWDDATNTRITMSFKDKLVKNAMSGSNFDVTIYAAGKYIWSAKLNIKAVAHLNKLLLPYGESSIMVNVFVAEERVFVVYEGISVLDLKTGKLLWQTNFDMVEAGMTSQVTGRCPMPVVEKDAVYITDFTSGADALKKMNINTGEIIWKKTDVFSKKDVISDMYVTDKYLILKFGGYARKAKSVYNPNNGATTQVAKIDYEGDTDTRVYDKTTGILVWSSAEKLKNEKVNNSEASILVEQEKIIICSPTDIYLINLNNGTVLNKASLGKMIGKPQQSFIHNNNYIVEGEKGFASFKPDLSKNYETSTGQTLFTEFIGDAFIVWTGKDIDNMNEFIRFDLETGKILGKQKDCYTPRFDSTGNFYLRFKDQTLTKYKTN